MSDVATVISKLFVGTGGEAGASCSRAFQPKSKGAHPLFAETAPLARLREELRSNNEQVCDIERPEHLEEPEVAECQTDPKEFCASSGRPRHKSLDDDATGPAEEETASLEVASPAGEVARHGEATLAASPSNADGVAGVSATGEVEVVSGMGAEVTTDVSLAPTRQSLNMVAQAGTGDGGAFSQVQAGAVTQTDDGRQHSLQSEVVVSVDKGSVEVSARVSVSDQATDNASDKSVVQSGQPAVFEGTRTVGADAATVVVKEQTGEVADAQAKASGLNAEVTDTPVAATGEAAARPQGQTRSEVQIASEGPKESGLDKAAIASRGSQTPERTSDDMPREDGQTSSQQDHRTASQGGVQVVATPEQDKQAFVPGFKNLVQPQAELTAAVENQTADASARPSAQTPGSASLGAATTTKSPVQDVGEQILSSVHASLARADKQVQIRLDPPELGSVLVRLSEQGDQIRGFLEVSRDETRREIEQALPQVLKGLQDAGVQVRRLEVVVSDQPDRGVGREQSQQDAWTQQQQQHSDQQGYRPQSTSVMNWPAQTGFPQDPTGRDRLQAQGVQDRIDMLV
jgi:flagellar hook-length control protein FliK